MSKPFWLTPELLEAAETVELDYHHDHEDRPRGILRVTLPADDQEQPFVFRFLPKLTTGCRLQFKVELNDEVIGANLQGEEVQALYVAAEQRTFDDRNRGRDGDEARRAEILGAAEKAFRGRAFRSAS